MNGILPIPFTVRLFAECWQTAEHELRASIAIKHHDLDEEFITRLFFDELAYRLRQATDKGKFRESFLSDLQQAFSELNNPAQLAEIAWPLSADVTLHKRETEKLTGGDFGLIITRPQVSHDGYTALILTEYSRGLLCQAKLKRRNGKWGKLSQKQREVFPQRLRYLGLILYSYADQERHQLNEFQWQLCRRASVNRVMDWLRSGRFPHLVNSMYVIAGLGAATIGTDNRRVLEDYIRVKKKPAIVITISWPPDQRPDSPMYVYQSGLTATEETEQHQVVHLYIQQRA